MCKKSNTKHPVVLLLLEYSGGTKDVKSRQESLNICLSVNGHLSVSAFLTFGDVPAKVILRSVGWFRLIHTSSIMWAISPFTTGTLF